MDDSFIGFEGDSLFKLAAEAAHVAGKPNARAEFRPLGERSTVTFKCDGYEGEPINDVFLCPPRCGAKKA